MKKLAGINISGYVSKDFGLGVAVRANINAIDAAGIAYVINDANIDISKEIKEGSYDLHHLSLDNPYPINLIQINFDNLSRFFSEKGKSYFEGKYNIGFWAWELDTLPDEALPFFDLLDEIWVPSNFCADVIARYSLLPVVKIMHSVEVNTPDKFPRSAYNLPEDRFVILTMFDYHSTIERKNPIGVIDAYEQAFGCNSTEAILVIKTSIGTRFPEARSSLLNRIGSNNSILLIEEILESKKLYGLFACCDCFISLHRSEGFGLTMAEAMSLAKPVIATAYSGNTDFMTINNSFPVRYEMVSTRANYYNSTDENQWAEPDVKHAASILRYVFEHPAEVTEVAKKGQEFIKATLNCAQIGSKIEQRLKIIANTNQSKSTERDVHLVQFENQVLQQKIDALRNIGFVKLKERFKNFQNKISGKDRKYFWE